jgi:hypothetical protein
MGLGPLARRRPQGCRLVPGFAHALAIFENKGSPEAYEVPELRHYGRIEHITLQNAYVSVDNSDRKTSGFTDYLGYNIVITDDAGNIILDSPIGDRP